MRETPLPELKRLPTESDLSYSSLQDAINILGKDDFAFWTLLVPSQLLTEAHELGHCFGAYVELSTWMRPDNWQLTKHKWTHGASGEVTKTVKTSIGSRGA